MANRLTDLQRTVLAYRDPVELPNSKYYLMVEVGAMSGPMLVPADCVVATDEDVTATLGDDGDVVIQFSSLYPWYLVPREYAESITHEEMLRRHKEDREASRKLNKELWGNEDGRDSAGTTAEFPGQYV